MPSFGDGDSMSRPLWHSGAFNFPFGSQGLRETWYLRRNDAGPETEPFYALIGPPNDHMDSVSTSTPAGYVLDLGSPIGFAWTSQQPGMSPLTRYFKPSIIDHVTWQACQPPGAGYNCDVVYQTPPNNRFGYQRFGNYLTRCDVDQLAAQIGTVLDNGTLRLRFNPIWGNAIDQITHLPSGLQLVSQGIGDLVQSTLWYRDTAGLPEDKLFNPNQSGGASRYEYGETRYWAGSPVLSTTTTQPAPQVTKVSTTVRPLHFYHDDYLGNTKQDPLLWKGQFRLDTTLGCKMSGCPSGVCPDVMKVRFEALADSNLPPTLFVSMSSGGWLRHVNFGDCRQPGTKTQVLTLSNGEITAPSHLICGPGSGEGQKLEVVPSNATDQAIVVTSADDSLAVGFLRLHGSALCNGTCKLSVWSRCAYLCTGNDPALVIGSEYFHLMARVPQPPEYEETYFVFGPPDDVIARLQQINADGGNCEN